MEWFVFSPERRKLLLVHETDNMKDDKDIYKVLTRSKILDGRFDYTSFDRLVEFAANNELPGYDYRELLESVESVMTQLGIMPFDEASLPPEDPSTF